MIIIAVLLLAANLFLVDFSEAGSGVHFSQKILPVKFVYLDREKEIKNVWSNVTEKDSRYSVKFLDEKNNKEIRADEELMNSYRKTVRAAKFGYDNPFRLNDAGQCFLDCLAIDFLKRGEVLEEVHTVA